MKRSFGNYQTNMNNTQNTTNNTRSVLDADILAKETELAKREGILEERERTNQEKQQQLETRLDQIEKLRKELVEKLEKSSSMSKEDASKILLENIEKDLAAEISKKVKYAEEEAKLQSDERIREILADAMLHGVTNYVSEFTTSRVTLADEEMKGRIIGKEGRNIKAFEQATGCCDIIVLPDDRNSGRCNLKSGEITLK